MFIKRLLSSLVMFSYWFGAKVSYCASLLYLLHIFRDLSSANFYCLFLYLVFCWFSGSCDRLELIVLTLGSKWTTWRLHKPKPRPLKHPLVAGCDIAQKLLLLRYLTTDSGPFRVCPRVLVNTLCFHALIHKRIIIYRFRFPERWVFPTFLG